MSPSPIPPCPPPLPAKKLAQTTKKLSTSKNSIKNNESNKENIQSNDIDESYALLNRKFYSRECDWALKYPDIQKACYLAKVCLYKAPTELRLSVIEPILQVGPTCGLTALSMLFEGEPTAGLLLDEVKKLGYSNNGEMFSTQQMSELLGKILSRKQLDNEITNMVICGAYCDSTIEIKLKLGAILLVPYDSDYDHAPCLKFGHRAHWALIVGYLVDEDKKFYVIARHGKTKNLAVWQLSDLIRSNSNLTEFVQPVGHPNETFILPDEGIGGKNGLRSKFILIEGFKTKNEIII
uniref:Actin maturation protease n=1 Tax=Corethrella appendiculata TaxID=1370023 RepID=U5EX61_9DIPT